MDHTAMVSIRKFDPIEYLVERKLPGAQLARGIAASIGGGSSDNLRLADNAATYEKHLRKLPQEELQKLLAEERAKEASEIAARAEHEEQQRFFNLPTANADFSHWCKATYWTLDEAIALSFGKAPELVKWETVQPYLRISLFAFQYNRVRDLALRAVAWQQLYDPVLPGFFIAWADRNELPISADLRAEVDRRGIQVGDWKTAYDKLKAETDQALTAAAQADAAKAEQIAELRRQVQSLTAERNRHSVENQALGSFSTGVPADSKPMGARERDTLLKLVVAMAIQGYRFDPKAARNDAVGDIVHDSELVGLPVSDDTVRKWLREAAMLLPTKGE